MSPWKRISTLILLLGVTATAGASEEKKVLTISVSCRVATFAGGEITAILDESARNIAEFKFSGRGGEYRYSIDQLNEGLTLVHYDRMNIVRIKGDHFDPRMGGAIEVQLMRVANREKPDFRVIR